DPTYLDPALVSDGESFRITKQIYEGLVELKPGTTQWQPKSATRWTPRPRRAEARAGLVAAEMGHALAPEPRRQDLDVHVAPWGQVPRRHAVQLGRCLRELQPVVQLDGAIPGRVGELLLPPDLRRVQEERVDRPRGPALPKLPGQGTLCRGGQAAAAQRTAHPSPRTVGLLDAEPDGDAQVRGEQGRAGVRDLQAHRHLRLLASHWNRSVQVRVLDRGPAGRLDAEQLVLGQEVRTGESHR